jgi:hypothetical protein
MRFRRPLSRSARAAIAAIVLVDVAVLGTDLFLLNSVSATTVVDLDDALVDFRTAAGPTTPVTSAPAGGAEVTDATLEPATAAVSVAADTAGPPPASTTVTSAAPAAAPAAFTVPAAGVYRYRTTGGENVSVLGAHHNYPAETFAVVTHTGGCGWHVRAEVVREHVDERQMCSEPGQLLQVEQTRTVEFFGTRDGGGFVCDPAQVQHAVGDGDGATWSGSCGDGRGSAALVRTTLGTGQMTIGGVTVDVIRLRVDGTLTGFTRGTSRDLMTVVAATGLPVIWERTVDTVADAFGGSVRYQEQARFELVSLTPAT